MKLRKALDEIIDKGMSMMKIVIQVQTFIFALPGFFFLCRFTCA